MFGHLLPGNFISQAYLVNCDPGEALFFGKRSVPNPDLNLEGPARVAQTLVQNQSADALENKGYLRRKS